MGIFDDIDMLVKTLIYIPIILVSIYVLYVLGKGAKHKIDEGTWPSSWYVTFDQLLKSGLFVIWPIIGIFKILKYIIYDVLYLKAWNNVNKVRSLLLLATFVVVTLNYIIYLNPETLKFQFLIDYSKWIVGLLSVASITFLGVSLITFIGRARDFPEKPNFKNNEKWEDLEEIQKKFVYDQGKAHLKATIMVGLCVAIIGMIAYYALHYDTAALATNYIITYVGTIILMFFGYNFLKNSSFFKGKYGRILFNILFIIPCGFFMLAEYLYKELKHTPKSAYYVLMAEIVAVILLIIVPLIKRIVYTKTKADSNSTELSKQKLDGTMEELNGLNIKLNKMTNKYDDYLKMKNWEVILSTDLNNKNKEQELISYLIEIGLDNPEECKDKHKNDKAHVKQENIGQCETERVSLIKDIVRYVQAKSPQINTLLSEIDDVKKALEQEKKEYEASKASFLTSKILLDQPRYLNRADTIGTFENLPKGTTTDGVHNFNYSLSCWVFIHSNPSNFKRIDDKFCSILNYNGKPELSYNVRKNTLRVTMIKGKKSEQKEVIFEEKNFPLQKWNNIVINYHRGTLDIFINSKLKNTYTGVIPYMEVDSVVVGEDKGVSGGICNVLYSPSYMSKFRIETNYNLLKNKNPPVV